MLITKIKAPVHPCRCQKGDRMAVRRVVRRRPGVQPGQAMVEEAAPRTVSPEDTVPVHSTLESSLRHEALRQQSAHGEDDDETD